MPDALMSLLTGGMLGLGWWAMLAVLLVFTQITIFSVTLYLHRSQAHRGVDFHPALAHVPTVSQLGLGDIDGTTYLGILAAAGTPKDVLDKLSAALQQAAKDPQYVETMRTMGAVAQGSPPAEFQRILHAEQTLAQQAVKDGRLKAD